MSSLLAPLGLSAGTEQVYRAVLRTAPVGLAELGAEVGLGERALRDTLDPLLERGLVRETAGGLLDADDPRIVVSRLVDEELTEVRQLADELDRTRGAIAQLAADHLSARRGTRRPTWEVVPADLMSGVVLDSIQTTSGEIRSSAVTADWSPDGIDQVLDLSRRTIASGRPMRSLYPLTALASPSSRAWMARFAAVGEQQRLVREPLSEFVVLGDDLVIATTTWGSVDSDYVMVRDPMLVQTFRRLFDLAWEAGVPPPDAHADDADERRLVTLLAAGHKDETIARHLGVSLRTVRRRVALLMDEVGVGTRFQLGMALARRDRPAATTGRDATR